MVDWKDGGDVINWIGSGSGSQSKDIDDNERNHITMVENGPNAVCHNSAEITRLYVKQENPPIGGAVRNAT